MENSEKKFEVGKYFFLFLVIKKLRKFEKLAKLVGRWKNQWGSPFMIQTKFRKKNGLNRIRNDR